MMEVIRDKDKKILFERMKQPPINLVIPKETRDYYGKRYKECGKKKWTMSKRDYKRHEDMLIELE
jgi:hypothetical protein